MDGTVIQISSYMHTQITGPSVHHYHGVNCMVPSEESTSGVQLICFSVTNYNVIISVLVVFLLLCKGIMWIMGLFYPLISLILHAILAALFAVSIHAQAAPDMSDPAHPQPGAPWYITKSCGPPVSPRLNGYCKQAKAAFAVSILLW